MTQLEYAQYLYEIINEELYDDMDIEDQFYGYFQSFMPNGDGLEKVFKPIKNGELYFKRLIKIFNPTKDKFTQLEKEGVVPAYFCPPQENKKEVLISNAKQYLENMKLFSKIVEDKEFTETVHSIKTIEISDGEERNDTNYTNNVINEMISEWFIDNTDYNCELAVLSEAFYSINCDYFLSYYFQYPSYQDKLTFDLFEPYFEIWEMGHYCWFEEGKLIIGK